MAKEKNVKVAPKKKLTPAKLVNSSMLEWPTDIWGLTREYKAAVIALASRLNGADDKKELFDATHAVAMQFINDKFEHDKEVRESQAEAGE